jgi:predicted DNA-binding protein with PD1-like motif
MLSDGECTMSKLFLCAAIAMIAAAQQTRVESGEGGNAAEAARPNSDKVPDGYAITSQFQKVVILRFKYDTDLLAGMEKMMKENQIRNAVILSAAGSVRGYQIHQVNNRTLPAKIMTERDPNAPADLISMNGYVIGGKVHAHMTLATPDKAFGGHLHADTKVFTFAIVTVGVLPDDLDLSKVDQTNYR